MTARKPILFIMHRLESEPGVIGQWARRSGFRIDIRRPRFGDPLPPRLDGYAGVVLFGGPMSANDPDEFIRREINWIAVPLAENKPFFGICLGAQMLAKHLGARVFPHQENKVEVGYEPITPSEAGASFCCWPRYVYHWHGEGFSLSSGSDALAHGQVFENQAFRYGSRAFGVQFHPEITLAMIHKWTAKASERLKQPGAQCRKTQIAAHEMYGAELRGWTFRFLDRWIAGSAAAGPRPALQES
jgi:GMP synthase (glutamine-hydrolysing)